MVTKNTQIMVTKNTQPVNVHSISIKLFAKYCIQDVLSNHGMLSIYTSYIYKSFTNINFIQTYLSLR